jgi:hypothetical protein
MDNITKISECEVEVTKTIPEVVVTQKYERGFIEEQIKQITKQRDEMIALKEKELKECTDILSEMDKLEVITKEEVAIKLEEAKKADVELKEEVVDKVDLPVEENVLPDAQIFTK